MQTPQGFKKSYLIEAYDKALKEGYRGTDDASLVERAGYEVKVVDGDYQNIKITTRGSACGKQSGHGIRCTQI